MAIYRHVHTSFWQDTKVMEEMTPEDKYFYLYLLTNPNTTQIGIYPITKKQIAFDMGYSIESAKSLVDRFQNYHKIIIYNEETREIALLNWGKYNFNRGGKPIEDCVNKELKQVKDKKLIEIVSNKIENLKIKSLFLKYLDDTSHDMSDVTSTIRGQKEKEKEKEKKDSRKLNVYDDDSTYMELTQYLKDQILSWKPNAKIPNDLNKWADEIRKMVEMDSRTPEEIKDVIDFATTDSFWQANILSASSIRSKFDQLQGQLMTRNKKVTPLPNRNEPSRGNVTQQSTPNVADELRRMEEMKRKRKAKEA